MEFDFPKRHLLRDAEPADFLFDTDVTIPSDPPFDFEVLMDGHLSQSAKNAAPWVVGSLLLAHWKVISTFSQL